ncbi:alpha-1A adrenergic receptor-like [Neocloeon triangulifer]|uniref:alpha-1A adrenergic receptor-like n=1 Tax=Neocloeon triangulifer TaxID=2078957 RepID=UPI00286F4EE7|nr:alpha-1A adrenergic receptor-like [Neocloeon triangulifer]
MNWSVELTDDLAPNNDTDDPTAPLTEHSTLFLKSAGLGLMVALTIGGNLLVIIAVLATPCGGLLHRSPTHLLIANLAAADLLLGVVVLPLSAARELAGGEWPFGRRLCAVWAAADVLCCTASILSLCGISVDRFVGVTRPLAYSGIVTKRRAGWMILLIWALALAISIGPPLGWNDTSEGEECGVNKQLDYVIFSVVGSFYLPMLVIVILYFQVYRAVAKRSSEIESGKNVCGDVFLRVHYANGLMSRQRPLLTRASTRAAILCTSKFTRQKKAAQTLAIVVGGFLVCWLPFFIILPIDSACASCGLSGAPFTFAFWLGYFNSCINPFIYACSSYELRRAFRAVLCGRTRGFKRSQPNNNSPANSIPLNHFI